MAIVYVVTNKLNGKRYVGQTLESLAKRKWRHENMAGRPDNDHHFTFQKALAKYGFDQFVWEVVFESDDIEAINHEEVRLIETYNTMGEGGYNETVGGVGRRRGGRQTVSCKECSKSFTVEFGHYNRNVKLGQQFVCSRTCMAAITSRTAKITSRGERNHGAKLTTSQVEEIRQLAAQGVRQIDIAAKFSITQSHVSLIVNRRLRTID